MYFSVKELQKALAMHPKEWYNDNSFSARIIRLREEQKITLQEIIMIYMFLAAGFEETEALCPLDLLRRAGLEVSTVGIGGKSVTGAHGITVEADMTDTAYIALRDDKPDMIILPGGMPGTLNLDASDAVAYAIRTATESNAYLAAICAAPLILGRRGLLKGRRATCYPGFEDELVGALEIGGRVIRDGKIITAVGMGAAAEFGFELISVLKDPETAGKIREAILA